MFKKRYACEVTDQLKSERFRKDIATALVIMHENDGINNPALHTIETSIINDVLNMAVAVSFATTRGESVNFLTYIGPLETAHNKLVELKSWSSGRGNGT